jgi:hypothetical protein
MGDANLGCAVRLKVMVACLALVASVAAGAGILFRTDTLTPEEFLARYETPLEAPVGPRVVYHLGHSLVGRDMPAMLAQMAPGQDYASQLGWGASLRSHWIGEVPGFEEENANPRFEPAAEALASGRFDTVVLTEMVEIKDAIKYHDSAEYLTLWTRRAHEGNPDARVYLYESWHALDDPAGWLARLDGDLPKFWEGELLRPAMADEGVGTIYAIPGGQVMAAFTREIDAGHVPGMRHREELFARNADGSLDQIHFNDLGAYLMALTHYAVIYQKTPVGLPYALKRADGTAAVAPAPEVARKMQEVVWNVVTRYRPTGIGRAPAG